MSDLPAVRLDKTTGERTLEFVENDLKVALTFAQISSAAYSTGRLQHAGDARSKAEAAHARAVAQLIESLPASRQAACVQSMLKQVQSALSSLPPCAAPAWWKLRAAG